MNQVASLTSAYESIGQAFKRFFEQFFDTAERIKNIFTRYEKVEQENREAMWLWRKCGGIFYGAKTTVCAASSYYNASSKSGMGRMRECSSGAGTAAVGVEETEHEEKAMH